MAYNINYLLQGHFLGSGWMEQIPPTILSGPQASLILKTKLTTVPTVGILMTGIGTIVRAPKLSAIFANNRKVCNCV